ncbi:MAG: HslU--HslV peptidase ATPase subunit [Treponema sp. GWC1_61_84]|nr:MAG: HslU--HslV peptidase ATPase subunit [Treponema sp. GWC1_61_84]
MEGQDLDRLTPREIVAELDKYIVGQRKAKRAVAVALRNRIRRLKVPAEIRDDITPKNILMIGPTGVGKTEIARRLAKLSNSPFLKVEATKYTEVGYVGRDVESMIRDLMAAGVQMVKAEMQLAVQAEAEKRAEEVLLDLLLPGSGKKAPQAPVVQGPAAAAGADAAAGASVPPADATREKFRAMLREGKLDERTVEVTVHQSSPTPAVEILSPANMEDLESSLSGLAGLFGGGKKRKVVSVKRAKELLLAEEAEKLVDREKVSEEARKRVQETGIVFIDEMDKIASRADRSGGGEVSREGVQRDILPIVEGSTVNTKWGPVDTSHILFIAAGAFNVSKPSDLIPELQGRFPLRVELEALGKDDFLRILTEPKNSLTKQYADLLATEGVEIEFSADAIDRLASIAAEVNANLENIGARRLHTIMEALLEDLSFEASEIGPTKVPIGAAYVDERLAGLARDQDLGRYIL